MKKHKKMYLYKEKNKQKYVKLHTAKKFKYLKYLIVAVLTPFIFPCVFMNMDFARKAYNNEINNNGKSNASLQGSLKLLKTKTFKICPLKSLLEINAFETYFSTGEGNIEDEINSNTKQQDAQDEIIIGKAVLLKSLYTSSSRKQNSLRTVRQLQQAPDDVDLNRNNAKPENPDLKDQFTKQANIFTETINLKSSKRDAVILLAPAIRCQEYKENCTLFCSVGAVSYIDESLEQLQTKCRNIDLNLTVAKCEFYNGIFQQSFFYGSFSLGYLAIDECNLQTIKPNAFKHQNVKNLHTLILNNNQLISLEKTTFDGLTNLLNFQFVQAPLIALFESEEFLMPLANSLQTAVIQPSKNDIKAMDPFKWWQELQMKFLTNLDISNTNLEGILSSKTFQPFVLLEYLIISNCNLLNIKADVFDFISSSFKYLDVSLNHLQTLDDKFLQKLGIPTIELNLRLNAWHCECDNEMLQYFTLHDVKLTEETLCAAPKKWQQIELVYVINECRESEIIPSTTTSTSTAFSTAITTIITSIIIPNHTAEFTSTSLTKPSFSTTTTDKSSIRSTTDFTISSPTLELSSSTSTVTEKSSIITTTEVILTSTDSHTNNLIPLQCHLDDQKTESYLSFVTKPKFNFSLNINSSTSLTLTIQLNDNLQTFSIIYRTISDAGNDDDDGYNYDYVSVDESEIEGIIYIQNLLPSVAYVFCLVAESSQRVSPFDCKSHTIEINNLKTKWLSESDKVWFISVNFIAAVFLILTTILMVYILLLRFSPYWLIKHKNSSLEHLSITKKSSCRNVSPLSQRSSHYLSSLSIAQIATDTVNENIIHVSQDAVPCLSAPNLPAGAKICRTATFCSSDIKTRLPKKDCSQNMDYLDIMENNTDMENIIYVSQHAAPSSRAPHVPPSAKVCHKTYSSVCSSAIRSRPPINKNMDYLDMIDNNDPDYQTIDHYEVIEI